MGHKQRQRGWAQVSPAAWHAHGACASSPQGSKARCGIHGGLPWPRKFASTGDSLCLRRAAPAPTLGLWVPNWQSGPHLALPALLRRALRRSIGHRLHTQLARAAHGPPRRHRPLLHPRCCGSGDQHGASVQQPCVERSCNRWCSGWLLACWRPGALMQVCWVSCPLAPPRSGWKPASLAPDAAHLSPQQALRPRQPAERALQTPWPSSVPL